MGAINWNQIYMLNGLKTVIKGSPANKLNDNLLHVPDIRKNRFRRLKTR